MLEGFKEIGGPINAQVQNIEAKYEIDLALLEQSGDKARNDFFKLPKDTRDTSVEGKNQKYIYEDSAYNISILEHQKNIEVSTLRLDRYKRGRAVRLENI